MGKGPLISSHRVAFQDRQILQRSNYTCAQIRSWAHERIIKIDINTHQPYRYINIFVIRKKSTVGTKRLHEITFKTFIIWRMEEREIIEVVTLDIRRIITWDATFR